MRFSRLASQSGAALIAGLAACSSGGDGGTNPNPVATQITAQSGNNQVAPAGTSIAPLEVLVRDASNNPVAGVAVTWAVGAGGGSVSAPTSTTGANGIASITRTLGSNAGTQTTTATRSGLTGSPVTFTATATIQGATQIADAGGIGPQTDSVLATLSTPYAVIVRDHTNAPVANVTVTWTAAAGTMSPPTSTTNASGIAMATHTLGGTAGTQTAQAAVTGLIGSPVGFSATATAGNPVVLLKTSGDGGSAGLNATVTYTVAVRDAHGNAKAVQQVDWAVPPGTGSITPASNTTGANGEASAMRTLTGTAGPHTATAIAPNNLPTPDTVTFTTTATAAPTNVSVQNNFFNPSAVTIAVGGTVSWNWNSGGVIHNVTFDPNNPTGNPANIPNQGSGSGSRQFTMAGTFQYVCTIHESLGMIGSVTVQ
jgi:plastocyanin